MAHQQRANLENEIQSYKRDEARQQQVLANLNKQKAQAAVEAEEAAAALAAAQEDCQAKDVVIASLHAQVRLSAELLVSKSRWVAGHVLAGIQ